MSTKDCSYVVLLCASAACGRGRFDDIDRAPVDAAPGPALVQQATTTGTGTSLLATLPALPRPGDVLIMVGAIQSTDLARVTGGGVTWQLATSTTTFANAEIWYGVTDATSATVQIEGTEPSELWLSLTEWRGIETTSPVDAAVGMFGATSPASAGSITAGDAGDLVLFAVADRLPNTFGVPTGAAWIALDAPTGPSYIEQPWYTISAPLAILAPTVSETAQDWGAVLAAFRVASP